MLRIWNGVRNNGRPSQLMQEKDGFLRSLDIFRSLLLLPFLHVCIIKNLHFERELTNPHLIEQGLGESTDGHTEIQHHQRLACEIIRIDPVR